MNRTKRYIYKKLLLYVLNNANENNVRILVLPPAKKSLGKAITINEKNGKKQK